MMTAISLQPLRSPLAKALLVAALLVGGVAAAVVATMLAALPEPVAADARPSTNEEAPAPRKGAGASLLDDAIGGFE